MNKKSNTKNNMGTKAKNKAKISAGSSAKSNTGRSSGSKGKGNAKGKTSANKTKQDQILALTGMGIMAIQLIISIIFMAVLHYVDMVPLKYKILVGLVLILCVVLGLIAQRWKITGIITKVLSLFMSVILIMGIVYIGYTRGAIERITGTNTKTVDIAVYVRNDDPAKELNDIDGYSCGKLATVDADNTKLLTDYIDSSTNIKLDYVDYNSIIEMVDALLSGNVKCIILNTAYMGIFEDMDGYGDVPDKIRPVFTKTFESKLEDSNAEENYLQSDDVICIYVSGIDTTGPVSTVSRSDVNILVFINTNTHQILMINTPRDYYVPLSISGGARDKLTHAGIYGIDVSKQTLEMLYGANVDYYFKLNFTGCVNIINELGGVDVYSEYDFSTQQTWGYHFNQGYNHVDGEGALAFARERYAFAEGDRQRGKNQMAIIKAVIEKMTSSTSMLTNYVNILNAIAKSMATDMPYEKIGDLVKMQLDSMPSWDVQTCSVDGTGASKATFSMSSDLLLYVMVPDESTVTQAKEYISQMYRNERISVK
ncbi:MAG: LCP family protein [Eubacterium sp.]